MSNKASVEYLLKLAETRRANGFKSIEVEVKSLGLTFTVVKQPLTRIIKLIDDANEDTLEGKLETYKELIYTCVPIFQDPKLQAAYECAEPFDVITKVLDDNITAISELGEAVTKLYGLSDGGAVEQVKN